jgi:SAM-dependent methyltransferase
MFEKLIWYPDRLVLGNLVFRLALYQKDAWDGGESHFEFYKTKPLIDQYEAFWAVRKDFHPANVLELGVWDGGSVAFWFECLQPEKHVGVDLKPTEERPYFDDYVRSRGLGERIKVYWETNQADDAALRRIVEAEFDGPLDMVIDDASHLYGPTRASFETLFPLLRPGGLYVIEDWAWGHWKAFQAPDHPWSSETALTEFITELLEATGSSTELISNLTVFQGFVAVQRGPLALVERQPFALAEHISRRAKGAKVEGTTL